MYSTDICDLFDQSELARDYLLKPIKMTWVGQLLPQIKLKSMAVGLSLIVEFRLETYPCCPDIVAIEALQGGDHDNG